MKLRNVQGYDLFYNLLHILYRGSSVSFKFPACLPNATIRNLLRLDFLLFLNRVEMGDRFFVESLDRILWELNSFWGSVRWPGRQGIITYLNPGESPSRLYSSSLLVIFPPFFSRALRALDNVRREIAEGMGLTYSCHCSSVRPFATPT